MRYSNTNFLIIILLIFILYLLLTNKTIEMFSSHKKIVSIYSPQTYFGIGDYIMGIIYLLQNEKDRQIYINYETNEIAKYLKNIDKKSKYSINNKCIKTLTKKELSQYLEKTYKYDNKCINVLTTNENTYDNFIKNNNEETIYIHNNGAIRHPVNKQICEKIKKMFTMKKSFKKIFDEKLKNINLFNVDFTILHIRLNDDVFTNDKIKHFNNLYDYIDKNIVPKWGSNVVIMSNSRLTKEYICDKYKFKQFIIHPVHTGAVGKNSPDDIQDTLIEFFTISMSKHIYQFCEDKNQTSGFSKRVSEIYNIDFIKINN